MDNSGRLEKALGHQFSDGTLLTRALTHRSRGRGNNERLEFLGDSLIGFVVADLLYAAFADAPEGVLSRLRASLVNQRALAKLGRQLDLGEYLLLGPGELKSGGFNRDSILCDAFESVVGAIYLDGGIGDARKFIERQFEALIAAQDPTQVEKDPKTLLQETLLGRGLPVPRYEVVEVSGPPHDRLFSVHCHVSGEDNPYAGEGRSRRRAEQAAATIAHIALVKEQIHEMPDKSGKSTAAIDGSARVWVNLDTQVFHLEGTPRFGNTQRGSYMSLDDAIRAGNTPARPEKE